MLVWWYYKGAFSAWAKVLFHNIESIWEKRKLQKPRDFTLDVDYGNNKDRSFK